MRLRSAQWLWCLPVALVGGCLLPSFENVPAEVVPEGGSDGGGSVSVVAGAAGEAPEAGAPAGGAGGSGASAPQAVADRYIVQQGKSLTVSVADGVLSNDAPAGTLKVTDFSDADKARPKAFDATLQIAADGSLTFKPAAAFFGNYTAEYVVQDASGQTATTTVTFVVQPSAVELSSVAQGIGGALLSGSGSDGVGTALAALGDVNADGYDDFAVGASGAAGGHGAIYVVFGRSDFGALSLGALAASSKETRFAVLAGSADAPVSDFVASAGRFNSDKVADILVGSPDSDTGRLFVVYGGTELKTSLTLSALPDARGVTLSGVDVGSRLGLHVSGSGDFNGDQKVDLLSGIHPGGLTKGGLCIVMANPVVSTGLDQVKSALVPDSGVFNLPQALTFVGDVSGDGKDDVLASSGRHVALLFGQGNGAVPTDISQVAVENLGLLRLRDNGVTAPAPVAAAGDVNGDKHSDFSYCDEISGDVLCDVFFGPRSLQDSLATPDWQVGGFAGAPALPLLGPGADLNQDKFSDLVLADQSAAYVVFGRDTGFGAVDVSSLGSDGFSLAASKGSKLASVATIGDVNGDGYGDFAVGEPSAAGGVGYVYVVFGGPFAPDQR